MMESSLSWQTIDHDSQTSQTGFIGYWVPSIKWTKGVVPFAVRNLGFKLLRSGTGRKSPHLLRLLLRG
jgi:hypothetical protein